jgi:hypothetical protein
MSESETAILRWLEAGHMGTREEIAHAAGLSTSGAAWRALNNLTAQGAVVMHEPERIGIDSYLYSASSVSAARRVGNCSIVERALAARTALELAWA